MHAVPGHGSARRDVGTAERQALVDRQLRLGQRSGVELGCEDQEATEGALVTVARPFGTQTGLVPRGCAAHDVAAEEQKRALGHRQPEEQVGIVQAVLQRPRLRQQRFALRGVHPGAPAQPQQLNPGSNRELVALRRARCRLEVGAGRAQSHLRDREIAQHRSCRGAHLPACGLQVVGCLLVVGCDQRRQFVEAFGGHRDQRIGDRVVQPAPDRCQQRTVGDLLGEGVPEAVLALIGLLEQLRRAQLAQGGGRVRHRGARGLAQHRRGERPTDRRRGLQHRPGGLIETVDSGGEHGLHARRNPDLIDATGQR